MATTEMSIKLVIDTKSNKVIFAEASKDFVDFLLFLLSLPIGAAMKLLLSSDVKIMGSIGNIYTSFTNLDEKYLQQYMKKDILLNPMVFKYAKNIPLSITESSIISSGKLYTCKDAHFVTNICDCVHCSYLCGSNLNIEVKFVASSCPKNSIPPDGYVKDIASYMIYDDLSIMPMSTDFIISIMNKFNVSKLEKREIKVGAEEALELLKTSFRSTTVLTDVFLVWKA